MVIRQRQDLANAGLVNRGSTLLARGDGDNPYETSQEQQRYDDRQHDTKLTPEWRPPLRRWGRFWWFVPKVHGRGESSLAILAFSRASRDMGTSSLIMSKIRFML